ncbi:DUF6603 domain-containing protein [Streptomyces sp. NPDC015125]|uniref:DUF6603 domain-containing protein n=1 Tax=Streptomyces sp. NPDC015125 TaxID=3364938 RepID=UPI0036FBC1ED
MPLTVDALKERLRAGSGGTVTVAAGELGVPDVTEMWTAHLPGASLVVDGASCDIDALTVSGTTALAAGSGLAVTARFTASGDALTGADVEIRLADWHVRTQTVDRDYGELADDGFAAPRLVLDGAGAGLVCTAGDAAAGLGGPSATFDLRSDLKDDITDVIEGVVPETKLLLSEAAEALGFPSVKDAVGYALKSIWYKHYRGDGKPYVLSGDVDLTDVPVVDKVRWVLISSKEEKKRSYFGVVEVQFSFDTSDIPVLSGLIPADNKMAAKSLTLMFTTASLSRQQAGELNTLLDQAGHDVPAFPVDGLKKGVSLGFDYELGGQERPVAVVWLAGKSTGGWSPPDELSSTAKDDGGGGTDDGAAPARSGPVRLKVPTLGYEHGKALIKIALQVELKGLVVDVKFALGVPLAAIKDVGLEMAGIGFSLDRDPVKVTGAAAYEAADEDYVFRLEGLGTVTTPLLAAGIAGGYAQRQDGPPSVFLFGSVGAASKEGGFGPPPFRVKGAYLGGGYNSAVRVPKADEVYRFPLVAGLDNPDVVGGKDVGPLHVLSVLAEGDDAWVTPSLGENWFAFGLRFTTFEIFETTALALAEFGQDLVISLLGITTAEFPPDDDSPWARVQVQTEALYQQSEGLLSLTAQLTPHSYLMDPACVLTGGLAACVWVGGSHEGEFVISLGGYHPGFQVPDHYPVVPRLGFDWGITPQLNARGEAYFALTPHAIMAGGALALTFHDGALKAWLTAHLDVLIEWDPFWFEADLGVTIGVSATIDVWFVHVTVSVELGVDLSLWGPPIGGEATIHLWFVSFGISFGADRGDRPAVDWTQFQSKLPPSEEIHQIRPQKGLQPERESTDLIRAAQGPDPWVVSTHGFSFTAQTAVPASQVLLGDREIAHRSDGVNIRPMDRRGLTSTQTVKVTSGGQPVDVSGWQAEEVAGDVPQSLWGDTPGTSMSGTGMVNDRLTGLRITVPAPHMTDEFQVAPGLLSIDPLPDGAMPLSQDAGPLGPVPRSEKQSVAVIASGIASGPAADARTALYAALDAAGLAPGNNDPLSAYAGLVTHDLAAAPLLATTSGS